MKSVEYSLKLIVIIIRYSKEPRVLAVLAIIALLLVVTQNILTMVI